MQQQRATPVPDIDPGWLERLHPELNASYFAELKRFLRADMATHTVYPPPGRILHAFKATPFNDVRVVILGQDPYHGPGQAHGLSFSVPEGIPPPPSLQNVFKEISRDLGADPSRSGDLSRWAAQGVLLLNTVLTVRAGEAGSHQGKGWERFTDAAIGALSRERQGIVFLLWGRHAMAKEALIDPERHHILKAPHPSPLSAHRGFLGSGHFGKANELLEANGGGPINWTL
ncbi:MAG: uracil-DNA glycosylase [Flavobacteriales bacterium]